MAADPGADVADVNTHHTFTEGGGYSHHEKPMSQNISEPRIANSHHMNILTPPTHVTPITSPHPPPGGDSQRPRSRISQLLRRRSQTLSLRNGSDSITRETGVQKPSVRPQDPAAAALRKYGSSTDLRRPAGEATRKRMHDMLAAANAENLVEAPIAATRETNETPKTTLTILQPRPIPIPKPLKLDQDVEMLEAQMLPPPLPILPSLPASLANTNGTGSVMMSNSLPQAARGDMAAASSSVRPGGLKRSASSGSQTVTIYECSILEVDEGCGAGSEEDLSFLGNDQELDQIMAIASASASSRRQNGRGSLLFKRSQEAAMQCSQVVRNVPRMRKRRDRKVDRRRQSLTMSESTICLSSTPSPTPVL